MGALWNGVQGGRMELPALSLLQVSGPFHLLILNLLKGGRMGIAHNRMAAAVLQSDWGGDTIVAVKIIVYTLTFGVILVLAGAIAALSLAVAPAVAKSNGWSVLAVILSGLAVAGGVV